MSLILFNIRTFFSIFLAAIAIKLIDDSLDKDGFLNDIISKNMGTGIVPYSILIFSFACILNNILPISLFLSSYIIGMFSDFNRKLTFKLKGYQESLIIGIIGIIIFGYGIMLVSFLIILVIQILDDLIDYKTDKKKCKYNLACKYGRIEVLVIALILILVIIVLNPLILCYCIIIFFIFQFLEFRYYRGN